MKWRAGRCFFNKFKNKYVSGKIRIRPKFFCPSCIKTLFILLTLSVDQQDMMMTWWWLLVSLFVCFWRVHIQEVPLHCCSKVLRNRFITKGTIRWRLDPTQSLKLIWDFFKKNVQAAGSRQCEETIHQQADLKVDIHCRELSQYLQNILSSNPETTDTQ